MTLPTDRRALRDPSAREFRRLMEAGVSPAVALSLADPEGHQLQDTRRETSRLIGLGVSPVVALTIADLAARQIRARRRSRVRATTT